MKPTCPSLRFERRRNSEEAELVQPAFPRIDYCFQSGCDFPRGYWAPYDDGDRPFRNLRREFLAESAREQKREFFVLSLILLVSAWPVISMVVAVVQLYSRQHP